MVLKPCTEWNICHINWCRISFTVMVAANCSPMKGIWLHFTPFKAPFQLLTKDPNRNIFLTARFGLGLSCLTSKHPCCTVFFACLYVKKSGHECQLSEVAAACYTCMIHKETKHHRLVFGVSCWKLYLSSMNLCNHLAFKNLTYSNIKPTVCPKIPHLVVLRHVLPRSSISCPSDTQYCWWFKNIWKSQATTWNVPKTL